MSAVPLTRLRGVGKRYRAVTALDDVDLDLWPGEVHCLAGENGAGKSTLIKILTGAETRDSGEYEVRGERMRPNLSPVAAREAGIGVVYQELSLLPELSVASNLCMGRFPGRGGLLDRRRTRAVATSMLDRVGLSELDPDTHVHILPTATRQLVEIARVLGDDAKLLIFDEPTTALSAPEADALLTRIAALRDEGIAVLYVSHRLEELFAIGDRVTVLRDGAVADHRPMAEFTEDSLVRAMVGRTITNLYPGRRESPGEVRLELRGLRPSVFAEPVDLTVRAGEVVGLAGLLGSGRSELLRAVFGADPVAEGEVLVDGHPVRTSTPRLAARAGIGLLTEDRKDSGLLPGLSVEKNVAMASLPSVSPLGVLHRRRLRGHVDAATAGLRVKFADWSDPITSLSGGNQQKALVARWRATGAKVLLLDEPTKGVDVGAKADIYQVIADLAAAGLAVVVVSSYLPELLGLCDRVAVLRQFRLIGVLPVETTGEEDILRLASPTVEVR
ncbi:MAG: ribose transport system ATP-binding protein [Actinomycetota bacterium]|jgi:ribose transport system ATP-binding protein/rhamnose transport system ATP-binding protein|nr:ribose transport system ATP-binding protein [Actinomycetota bacterium]